MIKIIKHGKRAYFAVCGKCFCEFSYELDDLYTTCVGTTGINTCVGSYINCPDCGFMIKHNPQCYKTSIYNNSADTAIKRT